MKNLKIVKRVYYSSSQAGLYNTSKTNVMKSISKREKLCSKWARINENSKDMKKLIVLQKIH